MEAIDGCLLALTLGATFVARFSGDKGQLVPISRRGWRTRICVRGRPLALRHVQRSRRIHQELRLHARRTSRSSRPTSCRRQPPSPRHDAGSVRNVMLHDGSGCGCGKWRRTTSPPIAIGHAYIRDRQKDGEIVSGAPLHLAGFRGHARTDRDRGSAPDPVAIRGAVSGRRGAGKAAKALPVTKFQSPTPNPQGDVRSSWVKARSESAVPLAFHPTASSQLVWELGVRSRERGVSAVWCQSACRLYSAHFTKPHPRSRR